MSGGFRARRRDCLALVKDEAKDARQRLLQGIPAHLAVSLGPVRIAHIEKRAGLEYGKVQLAADPEIPEVHVAAVRTWRRGILHAGDRDAGFADNRVPRRHGHDSHERRERDMDGVREQHNLSSIHRGGSQHVASSLRNIQRRVARTRSRIARAEHAARRPGRVDAERRTRAQLDHLDLEHVARFCAGNGDGAGQDMGASAALTRTAGARRPEVADVLQNFVLRNSVLGEERVRILCLRRAVVRQRIHSYRLSGLDRHDRRLVGWNPSPCDRFRSRGHVMIGRRTGLTRGDG